MNVTVTNPDTQNATLPSWFTYTSITSPVPTVTSVSPNNGSVNGGIAVTVTGTNFVSGATVSFSGTAATNVMVSSPTTITTITSAHATGAVDVTVTNPDTQSVTLPSEFTYSSAPADFVVTLVTLSRTTPRPRVLFNVSVVVKNQGAAAGDTGTLAVWTNKAAPQACGAVAEKTAAVGVLAAGGSKTI